MNDGGSATYTVSPDKSYTLDTVTLRVGSRQETAHVEDGTIKVGDRSYPMSLSAKGVLKVAVSNIRDDVRLSAGAVRKNNGTLFLRNGVTAPYFEGMGNYRFCPEDTLTRAEAVAVRVYHPDQICGCACLALGVLGYHQCCKLRNITKKPPGKAERIDDKWLV